MGLIPKDPVQNPCEAETFEEAALKNSVRLLHERDQAKILYEEMKKDGDKDAETMNPAFWNGALMANDAAYRTYRMAFDSFRREVAERLKYHEQNVPLLQEGTHTGWKDIMKTWVEAFEKDDPSIIVHW